MSFVKTPNLPESRVTHIIAGKLFKPFENELEKLGISVLYTADNPHFDTSLKSHADLFVSYTGNGNTVIDLSQKGIENVLKSLGLSVFYAKKQVNSAYPEDCLLNCVITDDIIICNGQITDVKLLEFAHNNGLKTVNVRQGYSKCSVLTVKSNAFITDDESIYNTLKALKYDVLYVKKGSVVLRDYDYGFIGGCAGKISENEIVFCGDVKKHSDYDSIKSFTDNYGIQTISLSDAELTDVGSIIPVIEK